jgi:hypothetical protein
MITLIGLLPLALTTFRETKRDTIHANILQYVASQANLTPFANLAASIATCGPPPNNNTGPPWTATPAWTFDDQGGVIQAATTNIADTSPAIYRAYIMATYTGTNSTSNSQASLLPGASYPTATYSTNTYLLTVEIIDTDQPNRPTTNTIVVANMGK